MKYKIHPFAETYPPMSAAELEALTEDIAARGLQRPITLYQGQILDGRNRYIACERAKVEPTFEEYTGDDPLGHANSLNLNRDLTSGQRAMIAARQWRMNGVTTDKGKGPRSKAEELQTVTLGIKDLAKHFRASNSSISQARDLLYSAPDLAAQVESCSLSLADAYQQLQERKKQSAQKARDAEKLGKYRELVSEGKITWEEATQKRVEEEREEAQLFAAKAQTVKAWLNEFKGVYATLERMIAKREDEDLSWYNEEDSPGWFDHGITTDMVDEMIGWLERVRKNTFGVQNGRKPRSGKTGR
jgi:hypothetical protein